MDVPEEQSPQRKAWSIERYSAVFAVLVSLTTLALLIFQTRLMQTQARASAWPHVSIGLSSSQTSFSWVLSNNGVGPAVTHNVRVLVDGKPQPDWRSVLSALQNDDMQMKATAMNSVPKVLTPAENTNDQYVVVTVQASADAAITAAAMSRVGIELCYCSIYDDCWISAFAEGKESKRKISYCPKPSAGDFNQ